MSRAREWISRVLLHTPPSLRALRKVPVVGDAIHRLSHQVLPSEEKVWAQIEGGPARGLWLELNPRTGQGYLRGGGEVPVQTILVERLRPGMVFYDLGANIGLFTLLAARLVGISGKVFSFEPDGENAARLRRNVRWNEFANVTVVEAGVWSASQEVNFQAADSSSPDRGIGRFAAAEDRNTGKPIRCVALDDFAQNAPPPDAIKCDVEGAEIEVLRGAEVLLRERHPWILCEMHSQENDRNSREFLAKLGYKVESVDSDHILALHQ